MEITMQFVAGWCTCRVRSDRAASLVEYALLVGLIAVVCIVAVSTLGKKADTKFTSVAQSL